jgi:hypothetical protein
MGDPNTRLCLHCALPVVNLRPWPEKGECGECPKCNSTFLFKFSTAAERERRYRTGREECALAGTLHVHPERWARALAIIAAAYKREQLQADAKRIEDEAVENRLLTRYVRARARERARTEVRA